MGSRDKLGVEEVKRQRQEAWEGRKTMKGIKGPRGGDFQMMITVHLPTA